MNKKYMEALREWQREYLRNALVQADHSITRAVDITGLNRTYLYKLCDKVGVVRVRNPNVGGFRPKNEGNDAWKALS